MLSKWSEWLKIMSHYNAIRESWFNGIHKVGWLLALYQTSVSCCILNHLINAMFKTLSLNLCTASIICYNFRPEMKLPELSWLSVSNQLSWLSVFNHARTSRLGNNHKGTEESLPPLSAVTLDSSKNWKSHILALNLYITSSPLWCMLVTSGVQASLEDLLKQVIYLVIFPWVCVVKISILLMVWKINLTNKPKWLVLDLYIFCTLFVLNSDNL